MPKSRSITANIINLAVFIALEIAGLNMLQHNSSYQRFFLARAVHGFQAKVWGGTESVKYYFSLKKANDELAEENFKLSRLLDQYREREAAIASEEVTKRLDSLPGSRDFSYISGAIVKVSNNKQHNYLIVNKGSADGVTEDSGIITIDGIVGIVDAVSRHYSYVISFMNTEFSVSARLGREGAVGPLVWDGKSTNGAILKDIPLQNKFEKGDTVRTSGYSSIFPSDIPIGTIGDAKIVNGATYEIQVSLFQDMKSVRYVTIATNVGKKEIAALEKQVSASEEEKKEGGK